MNSRLLFAAARGAKIEEHIGGNRWVEASLIRLVNADQCEYRIHPKDKHLAYGPVSTAFRESAEFFIPRKWLPIDHDLLNSLDLNIDGQVSSMSRGDACLLLLIMGEALADDGL
jgi:hypothetical protein